MSRHSELLTVYTSIPAGHTWAAFSHMLEYFDCLINGWVKSKRCQVPNSLSELDVFIRKSKLKFWYILFHIVNMHSILHVHKFKALMFSDWSTETDLKFRGKKKKTLATKEIQNLGWYYQEFVQVTETYLNSIFPNKCFSIVISRRIGKQKIRGEAELESG